MFCSNLWCPSSGIKYASPLYEEAWLCLCRECQGPDDPCHSTEAPRLDVESETGTSQASSAFRWDFLFETCPLTLPAPGLFFGFPKRVGQLCLSGDLLWTIHVSYHIWFVSKEQMPQCRDPTTAQLVSWGLVYTAKILPGEFYQQKMVQIWTACGVTYTGKRVYRKTFWQQNLIYISMLVMRCDFSLMLATKYSLVDTF